MATIRPPQTEIRQKGRSRPVSCHFCRTKKLRCSRDFPCTNCTSREIACHLYGPPQDELAAAKRAPKRRKLDGLSSSAATAAPPPPPSPEQVALQTKGNRLTLRRPQTPTETGRLTPAETSCEATADRQSATSLQTHPRQQLPLQPRGNDAEWLERENIDQSSTVLFSSGSIAFQTCAVGRITRTVSWCYRNPTHPSQPAEPLKCIWLPLHQETNVLVDKYLNEIAYIHQVVHAPSLRRLVDGFYGVLARQNDVKLSDIALLLSVVAMATYSWTSRDRAGLFEKVDDANTQAASWVTAALDVLDQSQRTTAGALEEVQALVILSFVVIDLEGTSRRVWELLATATTLARHLGLHRIDQPSNCGPLHTTPSPSPCNVVQAEVGRRVWWYLAALDWLLSRYAGPHEGLYTIDPRHMVVNMPLNINDEQLVDRPGQSPFVGLPLSEPTSMSYFLQRVRLAQLCREFTERVPLNGSSPKLVHDQVMQLDTKLEAFLNDIPAFLSMEHDSPTRTPAIIIQRYVLNSMIHTHRCKMHLPYLMRGSSSGVRGEQASKYARSRDICLQAARMTLAGERLLEAEKDLPFVLARLKFGGALYCIFMASIALLLGVCFDRAARRDESRRAEVVHAFGILEVAQHQNPIATKLLDSLMSVVRKHRLSLLPAVDCTSSTAPQPQTENIETLLADLETRGPSSSTVTLTHTPISAAGTGNDAVDPPGIRPLTLGELDWSCFDDIWQTFDDGTCLESLDMCGMF